MLDLTWVSPVISAMESILGLLSEPPLSYFIGLMLVSGVVYIVRGLISREG